MTSRQVHRPEAPLGPGSYSSTRQVLLIHPRSHEYGATRDGESSTWPGGGGADLDAVLTGFGNTLSFPNWYGHNLDALRDCLADVEGDTAVLWTGWQPFQRDNPQDWGRLVDVIGQRLDEDELDGFALLLS